MESQETRDQARLEADKEIGIQTEIKTKFKRQIEILKKIWIKNRNFLTNQTVLTAFQHATY